MTDIFDAKIMCKNCEKEMRPAVVHRNGLELRAVKCENCGDKIIHPADLNAQEHFKDLRGRTFVVKLRMVGNSHAISIPKEIVEFINEQHRVMRKRMDDMVRLCFEDFDTLRVMFGDEESNEGRNSVNRDMKEIDYEDKARGIKRRVRNYGRGNVEIIEEQNINNPSHSIKRMKVRRIRRFE
jgi:DNA-directed RNA polymerase subunit RPC12/RpoP